MTARAPRVSVVMSVCDGADHLAEAVESVLGQTYADLELVLLDDGSTDGSYEIGQAYAASDGRVRLFQHENRGLAASLNRGIGEARGGLVARMDADDVAPADRLARQVAFLDANPTVGLVSGQATYIDPEGRTVGEWGVPTAPGAVAFHLLFRTCLPHPGVVVRSETLRRVGLYDPSLRTNQDYDLFTRAFFETRMANLGGAVVHRRVGAWQLTHTRSDEQRANALAAMERMHRRLLGRGPGVGRDVLEILRERVGKARGGDLDAQLAERVYAYVESLVAAVKGRVRGGVGPLERGDLPAFETAASSFLYGITTHVAGESSVRAAALRARLAWRSPGPFSRLAAGAVLKRLP